MADYLHQFIFGIYPYIAIMIMVGVTIARYDRDQYTWKADSSQLLRSKGMRVGSNLFHIGIIFLFFGHLVGLLTPESVYHVVMTAGAKQILAMVSGGFFGVLCFIGLSMLLYRRLFDPRIRATSRFSDIALLFILYIQLILGLVTIPYSAQHLDGSSMIALANWAQHIVTFQPGAADFIVNEAWVFKAHLFLGLTIFLIFPFTRLVHMLSAPVKYLFRTGYQIVRGRGRAQ
ncbi:respiratory nitrate reductase subunit gamma [Pseudemcibacter aquimaris]|uniref:respiratory nitrate reductase subunit gamma n=1 Tax=Pseudemcibacter aquimaris TaxID=2857064 RepID=UPI0020139735|nr:respiratory nitrate reductase subunit gamma [Pseudemcibacter aquimaris]MCC3861865.1 respiratory nitrate reductase subunit gamma [Pseudemcibacter aquimaris]WDU58618.1 respiratory nitrate reductase subunit gamma [Pseudemcibacter aquimaris]